MRPRREMTLLPQVELALARAKQGAQAAASGGYFSTLADAVSAANLAIAKGAPWETGTTLYIDLPLGSFYLVDESSTLTPDGRTIVALSTGRLIFNRYFAHPQNVAQTDWYCDPTLTNANQTGAGTISNPVRDVNEVIRRCGVDPYTVGPKQIFVLGETNDEDACFTDVLPGNFLTVFGQGRTVGSGTLTAAINPGEPPGPGGEDTNLVTDTVGALSQAGWDDGFHRIRMTSGDAAGCVGMIAQNMGSGTYAISYPISYSLVGNPYDNGRGFPVAGNSYVIETTTIFSGAWMNSASGGYGSDFVPGIFRMIDGTFTRPQTMARGQAFVKCNMVVGVASGIEGYLVGCDTASLGITGGYFNSNCGIFRNAFLSIKGQWFSNDRTVFEGNQTLLMAPGSSIDFEDYFVPRNFSTPMRINSANSLVHIGHGMYGKGSTSPLFLICPGATMTTDFGAVVNSVTTASPEINFGSGNGGVVTVIDGITVTWANLTGTGGGTFDGTQAVEPKGGGRFLTVQAPDD